MGTIRERFSPKKILVVAAVLVITLAASELASRIFFTFLVGPRIMLYGFGGDRDPTSVAAGTVMRGIGMTPPTPENQVGTYTKFHPYESRSDTDESGERFRPTINGQGFRGEEFSEAKAPGVTRVVTLGASSTFGYHDRDDETYPSMLEGLLNAAMDSGRSFEVVNLGIPHLTSDQIYALFLAEALPLDPDVVTFYEGINDSHAGIDDVRFKRTGRRPGFFERVGTFARNRMVLAAFIESVLYYANLKKFDAHDVYTQTLGKSDIFLSNLEKIRRESEDRGIIFIVANQQVTAQMLPRAELRGVTYEDEVRLVRERLDQDGGIGRRQVDLLVHAQLMADLRQWSADRAVPFVDIIAALDGKRDVLLSWVHLNPQGNRVIAELLASEIREQLRAKQ